MHLQRSFQQHLLRYALTAAIFLLAMLLGATPLGTIAGGTFYPLFSIMLLYYLAVFQASLVPSWLVFLLGLIQDVVLGIPTGMSSLLLLLFRLLIVWQRRFVAGQHFVVLWIGFALASAVFFFVLWAALSLYHYDARPALGFVLQWLAAATLYPLVHSLMQYAIAKLRILQPEK